MTNKKTYSFTLNCLFSLVLFLLFSYSLAQTSETYDILKPPTKGTRCLAEVVNNDTIPIVNLNTIEVYASFSFASRKYYELWTRTKANVKIVYPYAILAAAKLKEYDRVLLNMPNKNLQKAFLKQCEKDLKKDFEEELKALTISQGKILMKLIDRETGKTTYEIVKQFRGGFQATLWQGLARLFGHNMKVEYDSNIEDIMIERAIKLVETGQF
jgi:hypothetical protein